MPSKRIWIILALIGFIWLLYAISGILFPFIAALFFAYLLNPLVDLLEKISVPRSVGSSFVTILSFTLLVLSIVLLTPKLYAQFTHLLINLSYYHQYSSQIFDNILQNLPAIQPKLHEWMETALQQFSSSIFTFTGNILSGVLKSGMAAFHILSLAFITPFVTYYILKDWYSIKTNLLDLVPKTYLEDANAIITELQTVLAGYLKGQALVCTILAIFYAVSLNFVGMEYATLLGIISGIITFIPYVGAIFGATLCALIAGVQFSSIKYALIVIGIFAVGQFLEGNLITPNLVGKRVSLHPVWAMLGLLAGAALMGFWGIVLAIPITATVGVLVRFMYAKYKKSKFYNEKRRV